MLSISRCTPSSYAGSTARRRKGAEYKLNSAKDYIQIIGCLSSVDKNISSNESTVIKELASLAYKLIDGCYALKDSEKLKKEFIEGIKLLKDKL